MTLQRNSFDPLRCEPGSDAIWCNLYSFLRPFVKRLVFSSGISSWRGQEDDIVDDIVQETISSASVARNLEKAFQLPLPKL